MITLAQGELTSLIGLEKDDENIPDGATIVGANGVFQSSSSPIFRIIKPTTKVFSGFKKIDTVAEITKKVPWKTFWQGPAWLKKQWDCRKNVEYIILLFYNPENDEYFWFPPRQDGSSAHLDYSVSDDEDVRKFVEEGCMLAGTMHNHFGNKGSAFQSGTDSHDEAKSGATGIHWTMGFMDCPNLFQAEFHIRIVSGDFDKVIKMKDCIDDPEDLIVPEEWDKKLDLKPTHSSRTTVHTGRTTWRWDGEGWQTMGGYSYDQYPRYSGTGGGNFTRPGSNIISLPPARNQNHKEEKKEDKEEKSEESSSNLKINLSDDGETILGDISILNETPEKSDVYSELWNKYQRIVKLAGGRELIRSMALSKAIYEGAQYALFTDELDEDREEGLELIMKDMASGVVGIMASIKTFFEKQIEVLEKDSGEE